MEIGIIGYGVVGSNLGIMLESRNHVIKKYDPPKKMTDNLSRCSIVFICVPTDAEDVEYNIIHTSMYYLGKVNRTCIVVLRSTVKPGTTDKLIEEYERDVIFMPEFLRERTAYEDTIQPDKLVIGGYDLNAIEIIKFLFMNAVWKRSPVFTVTPTEAELFKLAINTLYTIKVVFGNELLDICKMIDVDFWNLYNIFLKDKWINAMHLNPLLDSFRGAGGKCLPKDSNALSKFTEEIGCKCCSMIKEAVSKNNALLRARK